MAVFWAEITNIHKVPPLLLPAPVLVMVIIHLPHWSWAFLLSEMCTRRELHMIKRFVCLSVHMFSAHMSMWLDQVMFALARNKARHAIHVLMNPLHLTQKGSDTFLTVVFLFCCCVLQFFFLVQPVLYTRPRWKYHQQFCLLQLILFLKCSFCPVCVVCFCEDGRYCLWNYFRCIASPWIIS